MPPWIDPRSLPSPPYQGPPRQLAAASEALGDLLQFCRDGRLYDVERWIADDKPLQATPPEKGRAPETALEIALGTGNHALAHLLVCNGYLRHHAWWSALIRAWLSTARTTCRIEITNIEGRSTGHLLAHRESGSRVVAFVTQNELTGQ